MVFGGERARQDIARDHGHLDKDGALLNLHPRLWRGAKIAGGRERGFGAGQYYRRTSKKPCSNRLNIERDEIYEGAECLKTHSTVSSILF